MIQRYRSTREMVQHVEMANWVHVLAPWDCFCTFSFAWESSIWSAERCYLKYMNRHFRQASNFYALEQNPSRDGYHVHAIWAGRNVYRREAWHAWWERFGRCRVEPVRNKGDTVDYCSKYVCKEGAWWNLKIMPWHRNREPEALRLTEGDEVGAALAYATEPVRGDREEARPARPDTVVVKQGSPGSGAFWAHSQNGVWHHI